jgi:hypothetical protein
MVRAIVKTVRSLFRVNRYRVERKAIPAVSALPKEASSLL